MYKCDICQQIVPAGTKAHRLPVEFRFRRYPHRKNVNRVVRDGRIFVSDDPGGEGYEIAREITACPDCAAQFKKP
jgi:hypothetical protein